jgi:16S rRNA (cytosine967-C5)-methyltransferase
MVAEVVAPPPGGLVIDARAGASNVQAIRADLSGETSELSRFEGKAERVLVDAPCTGLGAIRRNPEVRWRLAPDQVTSLGRTQRELLRAAAALVAPKGRLIYATCSFLKREGSEVLAEFLASDPRFTPVTARDVLGRARSEGVASKDGRYLQTWRCEEPLACADGQDGFFAGVARRVG